MKAESTCFEVVQSGTVLLQGCLSQSLPEGVDHGKGDAVIGAVQVAETYHQGSFFLLHGVLFGRS